MMKTKSSNALKASPRSEVHCKTEVDFYVKDVGVGENSLSEGDLTVLNVSAGFKMCEDFVDVSLHQLLLAWSAARGSFHKEEIIL